MGPVENPRTINLIQWTMQLVALILIYLSSYHQVASFSLVMAILVWSSVPDKWKTQVQVQYHRKFVKPKVRLLSEQEYLDQSRVETEKALRELRDYCQVLVINAIFSPPNFWIHDIKCVFTNQGYACLCPGTYVNEPKSPGGSFRAF